MSKPRKQYDKEFKLRVVEKSYEDISIVTLGRDLGISAGVIHRWRRELKDQGAESFPGNGKKILSEEESEVFRLKKQLAEMKMEKDILKKAIGIFSMKDGSDFNL